MMKETKLTKLCRIIVDALFYLLTVPVMVIGICLLIVTYPFEMIYANIETAVGWYLDTVARLLHKSY